MPKTANPSKQPVTDGSCVRVVDDAALHAERLDALRHEALANDHLVALAAFMNTAGNETRLRMLYTLWRAGELCVCDLADLFDITQPSASRHLRLLREKAWFNPGATHRPSITRCAWTIRLLGFSLHSFRIRKPTRSHFP